MGPAGNMRTGLFGGCFNPPHIGHLITIADAIHACGLERVFFIPNKHPPHKEGTELAPGKHRARMLSLSLEHLPQAEVSLFELNQPGTSYSYKTIRHYLRHTPARELFFILGMDAFAEIHTWALYPDILNLCNFLVLTRPGYHIDVSRFPADYLVHAVTGTSRMQAKGCHAFLAQNIQLNISSSDIRNRIRSGRPIRYLVLPAVEQYISLHNLYLNQKETPGDHDHYCPIS